uniref:CNNM transmembrane domain-containing protein n=1 Tax=Palpitomonas bilix TaxID=652834 RepID=A0A7S3CZ38_9EUKA|mmetsp:Transcript_15444/g.39071  ORF Transcript_15444/g.39071 Transcript_15444/m.39071 type:complete len:748 (+) Transcript_15444:207-2450(+)
MPVVYGSNSHGNVQGRSSFQPGTSFEALCGYLVDVNFTQSLPANISSAVLAQYGELCEPPSPATWRVGVAAFIVLLSSVFSALSPVINLDKCSLDALVETGSSRAAVYASRVRPLRTLGNAALCALLLGKTSMNALLSVLLARYTGSWAGFALSTSLILIFGEIVPQGVASRYALAVAGHLHWLMYSLLVITAPFSFLLGFLLDLVLGRDIGTVLNRDQIKKLVEIYGRSTKSGLSRMDTTMVGSILELSKKNVELAMTAIVDVFGVEVGQRLSLHWILQVVKKGVRHVPIYERTIEDVVGMMYMNDLLAYMPSKDRYMTAAEYLQRFPHRKELLRVSPEMSLDVALQMFRRSQRDAAIVHVIKRETVSSSMHPFECVGLVTFSDILKNLEGREVDESEFDTLSMPMRELRGGLDPSKLMMVSLPPRRSPPGYVEMGVELEEMVLKRWSDYSLFASIPVELQRSLLRSCDVYAESQSNTPLSFSQQGSNGIAFVTLLEGAVYVGDGKTECMWLRSVGDCAFCVDMVDEWKEGKEGRKFGVFSERAESMPVLSSCISTWALQEKQHRHNGGSSPPSPTVFSALLLACSSDWERVKAVASTLAPDAQARSRKNRARGEDTREGDFRSRQGSLASATRHRATTLRGREGVPSLHRARHEETARPQWMATVLGQTGQAMTSEEDLGLGEEEDLDEPMEVNFLSALRFPSSAEPELESGSRANQHGDKQGRVPVPEADDEEFDEDAPLINKE